MSLDARQLLEQIVRPALRSFGPAYSTPAAEQLVMGTAAQESSLRWVRQVGGGPGRGLWQIEPRTFLWLRDEVAPKKGLATAANRWGRSDSPHPDELIWNFALGAAYCRLRYIASPRPLPQRGDILGMAEEWKVTYNSRLGKGTADEFLQAWERIIAPARLWA